MNYSSGETYDGDWEEGQKHGRGSVKSGSHNFIGIWRKGDLSKIE